MSPAPSAGSRESGARRLAAIRCLENGPASGARNMAVDETLMDAARRGRVTLRFYGWDPGCLSLGRHQSARGRYDRKAARARGIDIVRRPTGGRAVYHRREVTYAVAAPAELWGGLRESYRRINRALVRGLRGLGIEISAAGSGRGRAPRPTTRACFRDPLPGEVTAAGRKLIGSAQWRHDGALLQHGSLLLEDDQHVAEELRRGGMGGAGGEDASGRSGGAASSRSATPRVRAASLADVLPELPDPTEIARDLREGFEAEFGVPVREERMPADELSAARRREERYRDPEWTWRR